MENRNFNSLNMNSSGIRSRASTGVEINSVLRNTYILLSMTIAFSALAAGIGMAMDFPYLGLWTLLPYFGLLYGVHKLKNSSWGLLMVFALTGWLGLTIAPILNIYIARMGSEPILLALGGTATIFFSLSAYTLITRKNLEGMGKFIFVGIIVAFVASIANIFLQITALSLAVSSVFIICSSALIMYQTSQIIHGGERNYIVATVTLYVSLYNIFLSLMHLIGFFNDE